MKRDSFFVSFMIGLASGLIVLLVYITFVMIPDSVRSAYDDGVKHGILLGMSDQYEVQITQAETTYVPKGMSDAKVQK